MPTHTEYCSPPPTIITYHDLPLLLLLILILIQFPSPATAQLPNTLSPPPPDQISKLKFDKSMAIVLVVIVFVFFLLGFLSVYTRHCTERRMRGRFDLSIPINRGPRGLDPEIIDTFPTFIYSTVKSLKIGRATLECAVCLNEFQEDETLRLIPICSHVFHPECIDAWLVNQSTCPVCRANLISGPGSVQIMDQPDPDVQTRQINIRVDDDDNNRSGTGTVNQNRPPRSRSTGFRIANLFPRSHSTGHSLVQHGDNLERFTLRLPDEVRNRLVRSTLSRTKSLSVTLTRESSERRGYRTESVGRRHVHFDRFPRSDRRGFNWTPSFKSRAGSTWSAKGSSGSNKAPEAIDDVGERSSDRLVAGTSSEDYMAV